MEACCKFAIKEKNEAVLGSVTSFDEDLEDGTLHLTLSKSRMETGRASCEETMSHLEHGPIRHLPYPFTPAKHANRQMDVIESTKSLSSEASSS